MRPFKQLGENRYFSQNGAGFNLDAKEMRPELGGETAQLYNATIQQTALRQRINGAVIGMNILKTGAF